MFKTFTCTTFIAVAVAAAAATPASAATGLCVPTTAGQPAYSGGADAATYCAGRGAKAMLMPDTVADQKKLIDLLPYITYKASGVGKKPTLKFTGLNVQISKKEYPGYGNTDGTGNLLIGDSGDRSHDQSVTDYRYSGSENLVFGSSNTWRGRANLVLGGGNRADSADGFIHGNQNTSTAYQTFVTGNYQNVNQAYKVIADGAGKDIKWVRYDGAGRVLASSEPVTGDAYYYGGSTSSSTKFNGIDAANCALSATVEGPDSQVTTPIVSAYPSYGFVYARFTRPTPGGGVTYASHIAHTVTAVCNKNR